MNLVLNNCLMILPGRKSAVGDIVVTNGKIDKILISPEERASSPRGIDLSGAIVMPGIVDAHCHAPMTLLRGVGGGLPLKRWLEKAIFPVEARMTDEDVAAGMTWGAMELLAGGVTCVADMYEHSLAGAAALADTGIKANVCRPGLAFSDGTPKGRLEECIDFVRNFRDSNGRLLADICIHSEYLTNEKFCRALAEANREFTRPLNVHVSETKREHEECIARHGKTPIAYLAETGLLDYGGYAAHCVWCTDDDFKIMADRNVSLVHNPSSNMKLASGFARVCRAAELGVNVALGTDGPASNDNLDMFEEMHLTSLVHKGVLLDPTVLSPWEVIEMATVNGAKALGRYDTGEIAVGKAADFCVVALDKPHLNPCVDPANLIVHSAHASDVAMTIVDGRIVYERSPGQSWMDINHERAKFDFEMSLRRLKIK
ncbi:MAG: amidohydrolase [Kiritimatiellae bacterium]|nr:amidohydrolase [Kiritimatiellia bacterium]